jgi:hypothetical protein
MKYKVTSKHPYFKPGVIAGGNDYYIISYYAHNDEWSSDILLTDTDIECWVNYGWIEKIQEKEFTKNDMIEYELWANKRGGSGEYRLNTWIEKYKK